LLDRQPGRVSGRSRKFPPSGRREWEEKGLRRPFAILVNFGRKRLLSSRKSNHLGLDDNFTGTVREFLENVGRTKRGDGPFNASERPRIQRTVQSSTGPERTQEATLVRRKLLVGKRSNSGGSYIRPALCEKKGRAVIGGIYRSGGINLLKQLKHIYVGKKTTLQNARSNGNWLILWI